MANGYGSSTSSSLQNLNATSSNGQTNGIKKINNLLVDTSEMPSAITSRKITINGEIGAKFTLQIIGNSSSSSAMTKYYDFTLNTFTSGHISAGNNLTVTMSSRKHVKDIIFPSDSNFTTYVVKLITSEGTEVIRSNNKTVITKTIEKQTVKAVITFQAASLASPLNYATTPTGTTSSGALTDTGSVNFDWTITNTSTDLTPKGFGFLFKAGYQELNEKALYVKTTTNVVGNSSGSVNVITVDSLTDIVVGSYIWSGTGVESPVRITAIDIENKILALSGTVTSDNTDTLTVKSYGIESIRDAIGVTLAFNAVSGGVGNSPRFIPTALTKTVRGTVSNSKNVTLTDTLGIAGKNLVTYTGFGVDNSSSNRVVSVTEDYDGTDGDGKVVVEANQTLSEGTELRFEGSLATLRILGGISINGYPSANKTIYFDLDEALSVGTAT